VHVSWPRLWTSCSQAHQACRRVWCRYDGILRQDGLDDGAPVRPALKRRVSAQTWSMQRLASFLTSTRSVRLVALSALQLSSATLANAHDSCEGSGNTADLNDPSAIVGIAADISPMSVTSYGLDLCEG
jgi:hypothetical protein